MATYTPTIGLEIHAELKTKTKMFCRSANDPHAAEPNTHICPVCLAHPGTLPVVNKRAVHHVLRVGTALGGTIADYTEFDRKNYFYPDLPKGYQISQYQYPLVSGGSLVDVALTRIHLEEDTARSQHEGGEYSLIDYNRAGVPLMELVTEPVIHDATTAAQFARELQLLLRTLGVSEANMEKGEMRVEANISVSPTEQFGTKVEVKNLNSFRSVERAITFEIARQSALLDAGGKVVQETRGWDEGGQKTFSQRLKENSHDYRYFPEPDITKLRLSRVSEFSHEALMSSLPELPQEKRARLSSLGFLQTQDVDQLVGDFELSQFFDRVAKELPNTEALKAAANFILNDIAGKRKTESSWLPNEALFVETVVAYQRGDIHSPQAKNAIVTGVKAATLDPSALPALVTTILAAHPHVVAEYKAGKAAALQYLIGQGMKESKGSANPQKLTELINTQLGIE